MLPAALSPMLVATMRPLPPVLLAAEFVVGLYLLFSGISYLRSGKVDSRRGLVLTPREWPKLYWASVAVGLGGGILMIAASLGTLLYRRLH
jgi:hypothetical protein